jgi:hypothetical protein
MKRQIVYPGAIPLETDVLNTNKNAMIALGHVLQDVLGTSTLFSGLGCVPTTPAGMTVNVNPGRAYSYQATDSGAYSSLAADAHLIVKQGILLDAVNFACPAPTTAGFSISYLIEGAFQEVDAGSVVLPYYNASNPAQAYSGPNGTGTSNTTYRDNTVQLQLKAGAGATTGSQVVPTPDAGFNGLWVVTVPYGATTITSAMISQYTGAPFLSAALLAQIQAIPLHGIARYTSSGTFTAPTGVTQIYVSGCGGGGGGAGSVAIGSTGFISAAGGGGGAGNSLVRAPVTVVPGTTYSFTIGAAGAAGAAGNSGGPGGTTSFAAGSIALGGGGGGAVGAAGASTAAWAGGAGGAGFPAGQDGSDVTNGIGGVAGSGGSSPFGGGGGGRRASSGSNLVGYPGTGFGSGGGGSGGNYNSSSTSSAAVGSAGAPGLLIIEW